MFEPPVSLSNAATSRVPQTITRSQISIIYKYLLYILYIFDDYSPFLNNCVSIQIGTSYAILSAQ
jgi:hypothetical protein